MEIAGGNGVSRLLPPGFRFHPTDEELVTQYLRRKAFGLPLPANIISDADLANHNPWDLPGWSEGDKERFFFVSGDGGGRTRRSAASFGYWRASSRDKPVYFSSGRDRLLVGMKKTLVFHIRKPARDLKTKWVLHEYRLAGAGAAARVNPSHGSAASPAERWLLCRIFRERNSKKVRERSTGAEDSSSSSSSSCVTETPEEESSTTDDEASSRSPAAAPPAFWE